MILLVTRSVLSNAFLPVGPGRGSIGEVHVVLHEMASVFPPDPPSCVMVTLVSWILIAVASLALTTRWNRWLQSNSIATIEEDTFQDLTSLITL